MADAATTVGRRLLAAGDIPSLLAVEREVGRAAMFDPIQPVLTGLQRALVAGQRIAELERAPTGTWTALLLAVPADWRTALDSWFALSAQQSRGAWFLPADVRVSAGAVNLPYYLRDYPRFAMGMALDEAARVPLTTNADALVLWALLEPWARALYEPLWWRADAAGTITREELDEGWTNFVALTGALGVEPPEPAQHARRGGGWAAFRAVDHMEARRRFAALMAAGWTDEWAARYRGHRVQGLLQRYYAKAGRDGRARRKQIITKGYETTLACYFGGDWLRWLEYIGESPHADERVVGEAPVPHILAPAPPQIATAAAEHGVPAAEIERMLAAVWGAGGGTSPVQERVAVLRDYFAEFDALHARQTSRMRPLWGLVDDGGLALRIDASPHTTGLFRELLSAPLLARIERAWGSELLARYPDAIVSTPFPHAAMAETFGPALRFWEGVALTAWFFCEGPSSRTDLRGLERYHAKELALLDAAGTPVDRRLFAELIAAESRLGPPRPIHDDASSLSVMGVRVTFSVGSDERRDGFEILRDIVTRHRRQWALSYLERYLRGQWEADLRAVSLEYHRLVGDRGKAPTGKQVAKFAAESASRWTGGDLPALLGMIGEKAPSPARRAMLLREDGRVFAARVFAALGGEPYSWERLQSRYQGEDLQRAYDRLEAWHSLSQLALRYVQLEEALGHPPEQKDIGARKLEDIGRQLGMPAPVVWTAWQSAIASSLAAGGQP